MPRVTDLIRKHLEDEVGLNSKPMPEPGSLRETEWCPEFEQLMRNRLLMGAFRYGTFAEKDLRDYAYFSYLKHKADLYQRTGNLEMLVDVANLALLEYRRPSHPQAHWAALDNPEQRCPTI